METLLQLQDKLNRLLRHHKALNNECRALQAQLTQLEEEIRLLNSQLEQARQENLALQISHAIPDTASRKQARSRMDAVISDIDKILSSLHE